MNPITLGFGLAPDVAIVNGAIYVAYGQETPSRCILVRLTLDGHELSRRELPDGFFNSWPRFGGLWVAYKRGAPTYGAALQHALTQQSQTFQGGCEGDFGLAVNESLRLVAYQNGEYPIWFGHFDGGAFNSGLQGAPDGLDTLVNQSLVTLRKDTRTSVPGIVYPVRGGNLVVGEMAASAGCGVQLDGDVLRIALEGQNCSEPRCATDGTMYAIVTWGGPGGVRLWIGKRDDIFGLPPAVTIGPIGDSLPPGDRLYDMLGFLESAPIYQPRVGLKYYANPPSPDDTQYEERSPDGRTRYVKFRNSQAFETRYHDDNWEYHGGDFSGDPPMYFTDPRWFPRRMAVADSHKFDMKFEGPGMDAGSFVTGVHHAVFFDRATCRVLRRDEYNRRMWLHALYPKFQWGPLGILATAMRAYDPTAGIHGKDRLVEVEYRAVNVGWCLWQAHRSDIVYANGHAEFTAASLVDQSNFYLVGGPIVVPALSPCEPPIVHVPPLPPPPPPHPYDLLKEYPMAFPETRTGVLGPGGKLGRPDVAKNRIVFDQDAPNDDTKVEVTKPDANGMIRFVKANKIINFPGTWGCDSGTGGEQTFARQFELRDPTARAADESPTLRQLDGTDFLMAFVVHGNGVQGQSFPSAPLFLGPVVS